MLNSNSKSNRVTQNQISKAKTVNLVKFLENMYPHLIRYDDKSRRYLHADHNSCVISEIGFYRFSTHDRGDQIQFLENYCGLSFQDSVKELARYAGNSVAGLVLERKPITTVSDFEAPEAFSGAYKCVWAYLVYKRRIPSEVVEKLFEDGTLYQARQYNNCVFLSSDCRYAELCGTTDKKFKQIQKSSEHDGYWCTGNKDSDTVYVCESAIDAISLMVLQERFNPEERACYTSMGGLKDSAIERLKERYKRVIIAVDNDQPAEDFRKKYTDNFNIEPPYVRGNNGEVMKDWNDVLRFCTNAELIKTSITEGFYDRDLPF